MYCVKCGNNRWSGSRSGVGLPGELQAGGEMGGGGGRDQVDKKVT